MRSLIICGSKRFATEIKAFASKLKAKGVLVYEPNFKEPLSENAKIESAHLTQVLFKGLTLEHFDWIRKADMCYIYNQDNYMGVSTTMELAFASALSKPIIAYSSETGDPCRDSLIDFIASSPEAVIKLL